MLLQTLLVAFLVTSSVQLATPSSSVISVSNSASGGNDDDKVTSSPKVEKNATTGDPPTDQHPTAPVAEEEGKVLPPSKLEDNANEVKTLADEDTTSTAPGTLPAQNRAKALSSRNVVSNPVTDWLNKPRAPCTDKSCPDGKIDGPMTGAMIDSMLANMGIDF